MFAETCRVVKARFAAALAPQGELLRKEGATWEGAIQGGATDAGGSPDRCTAAIYTALWPTFARADRLRRENNWVQQRLQLGICRSSTTSNDNTHS